MRRLRPWLQRVDEKMLLAKLGGWALISRGESERNIDAIATRSDTPTFCAV